MTRLALAAVTFWLSACAQLAPYAIDGGIWAPPAAHREAARREGVRQIERMPPAPHVPTDCDDLTRAGRADLCK